MRRAAASPLFWIGVGFALALAGTIGAWVSYRQPHLLLAWKPFILTQHQFDYELEFVKRGLVGEVFRWLHVPRTVGAISVFSWAIIGLLALLLVRFHQRFAAAAPARAGEGTSASSIWLGAVFVSPATFLQAGGDLGRLDPLLVLCQLGLLLQTLARGRHWLPVAVALTWIGTAVHELFLLAQVPLVLAAHAFLAWHQRDRRSELRRRGLAILGAAVVAAGCIAAWGRMEGLPAGEYVVFLQQHRGLAEPNVEGVAVLYNSLGANMSFAWEKLAAKAPWGIPAGLAVVVAYLLLGCAAIRWQRTSLLLLAAGVTGPLLLLLLAYDYGRWFSFAVINLLLAVAIGQQDPAVSIDWRPLRWTWLFAALGPFGVTIGFPWWF